MILIGPNRSPYSRRVAITPNSYGMPYEQRSLPGFGDRAAVRTWNPLGRIPVLILYSFKAAFCIGRPAALTISGAGSGLDCVPTGRFSKLRARQSTQPSCQLSNRNACQQGT